MGLHTQLHHLGLLLLAVAACAGAFQHISQTQCYGWRLPQTTCSLHTCCHTWIRSVEHPGAFVRVLRQYCAWRSGNLDKIWLPSSKTHLYCYSVWIRGLPTWLYYKCSWNKLLYQPSLTERNFIVQRPMSCRMIAKGSWLWAAWWRVHWVQIGKSFVRFIVCT